MPRPIVKVYKSKFMYRIAVQTFGDDFTSRFLTLLDYADEYRNGKYSWYVKNSGLKVLEILHDQGKIVLDYCF